LMIVRKFNTFCFCPIFKKCTIDLRNLISFFGKSVIFL
jgi:hypothetical protein